MSKEECLQQIIYLTDLALKSYTADLADLIICRATGMDEKRADIEQAELEKHIRDYEDMLSTLTEIYDRRQGIDFLMEDETDGE